MGGWEGVRAGGWDGGGWVGWEGVRARQGDWVGWEGVRAQLCVVAFTHSFSVNVPLLRKCPPKTQARH